MITRTAARFGAMSLATMLAFTAADAVAAGPAHLIAVRTPHHYRTCGDCGTVVDIRPVRMAAESGSGAGAVLGAIAGGVLGHQVGGGRGRDIATAGGAIAGGFAGNSVEKQARSSTVFDVTVRMDAGGTQTARVGDPGSLSNGSRVHLDGNDIRRM